MKILIAETNIEIIEKVQQVLSIKQPDWEIITVYSGVQCLSIIESSDCPDIVILGLKLSDMSGFELTGHIREDSDIPVIFLSDDKDIASLIRAFDVGANEYMEIPFSSEIFIARLKAFIRKVKCSSNII